MVGNAIWHMTESLAEAIEFSLNENVAEERGFVSIERTIFFNRDEDRVEPTYYVGVEANAVFAGEEPPDERVGDVEEVVVARRTDVRVVMALAMAAMAAMKMRQYVAVRVARVASNNEQGWTWEASIGVGGWDSAAIEYMIGSIGA